MEIANQFQQGGLFPADDRLVAFLKQMTGTLVATVESDRITGQQAAHQSAEWSWSDTEQQKKVVGDQDSSATDVTGSLSFGEQARQSRNEIISIHVVGKDSPAFDSRFNDMVQITGGIESRLTRHNKREAKKPKNINLNLMIGPSTPSDSPVPTALNHTRQAFGSRAGCQLNDSIDYDHHANAGCRAPTYLGTSSAATWVSSRNRHANYRSQNCDKHPNDNCDYPTNHDRPPLLIIASRRRQSHQSSLDS